MATLLRTKAAGAAVRSPDLDEGIPAAVADTPYAERARITQLGA